MRRLLLLGISALVVSQVFADQEKGENGIRFEEGMSWQQVLAEAHKERKYIFVDCYTTWCAPCKQMDKNVYPAKEVGDVINARFISVKVQMNKSAKDSERIKGWYGVADEINRKYNVELYPTFLFFSPDGKIVHRSAGGCSIDGFISLAKDALDSRKQYYAELANYRPGQIQRSKMKQKAYDLQSAGRGELAEKIAMEYLDKLNPAELLEEDNLRFLGAFSYLKKYHQIATGYLENLKQDNLYTRLINVQLLVWTTKSSSDFGFKTFYEHPDQANVALRNFLYPGSKFAAQATVADIIESEEAKPLIEEARKAGVTPDWRKMRDVITNKYDARYADRVVAGAKMDLWYGPEKDWSSWLEQVILYVENFGNEVDTFDLNTAAWKVFLRSNDRSQLVKALSWSEAVVKANPNWNDAVDTYANIIYKLGDKELALKWEEVAAKLNPKAAAIQDTLVKMKNNEPTWIK